MHRLPAVRERRCGRGGGAVDRQDEREELIDRRRDGDDASRGRGRAGDVGGAVRGLVALVPGRGHEHGPEVDDALRRPRLQRVQGAVGDAAGEGQDVHRVRHVAVLVGVDRPLVRGDQHVVGGVPFVPHLVGVQLGLRRDTRSDLAGHLETGHGAAGVRAVPVGVERVEVGVRGVVGRVRVEHVVVLTDEVEATDHLLGREAVRFDERRVVGLVGRDRARASEGGVCVVDPGVDDRDLHALTTNAEGVPDLGRPDERHARTQ